MDEQRLVGLMAQMIRSTVAEELQAFEVRIDARLQKLEERMDRMESNMERLEIRLTARLEVLETGLSDVRSDIAALTARVDLIKEVVDSLDERMTQNLEYLQHKWQEHDRELWNIKRKL